MSQKPSLHTALQAISKQLFDRVSHRITHDIDFSWMLHTPSRPIQDYFHLGQYGSSPLRYRINTITSRLSGKIWLLVVWPIMYRHILTVVREKYLPDVFSNIPSSPDLSKKMAIFESHLAYQLSQFTGFARFASFTELYEFLNNCFITFSTYLGATSDIYASHKREHTRFALDIYQEIRTAVLSHKHPIAICCYLAIRANWIDCAQETISPFMAGFREEINEILDAQLPQEDLYQSSNPYYHLPQFERWLQKPITVLYECDNMGEIVFDLLLCEHLLSLGHRIILTTKSTPVLNDVTYTDLENLLQDLALAHLHIFLDSGQLSYIETQSQVGGKYIYAVSDAYKEAYQKSHLLILKGQGHFYTMPMGYKKNRKFVPYSYKKPIVYMMGLKAPFIFNSFKYNITTSPPPIGSMILYAFHPYNPNTHPC